MMNSRRNASLALFVTLILTVSGSFGISIFSLSSNSSAALSPSSSPPGFMLNGSSVEIPISLPTKIAMLGAGGAVPSTAPISLTVVISSRNPIGLQQYINEVNSPISPMYHRYLSPQEYSAIYGPDSVQVNSLSSYFSSKGLTAQIDEANPSLLRVSGSAFQVESALGVSIDSFHLGNQSFYSPLRMPQLPSRFSFVQTILGLSNYKSSFALPMYRTFGPISGKPGASDSNNIYYTPSEVSQIYNSSSLMSAGYTGTGITIAIVDAFGDPYIQDELNNFSAQFKLPQLTVNQICVDGPCNYANGVTQGWQPEIALDVEWAHAMAPGAKINLYIGSNSSFPIFDAVEAAANNFTNSIISMSWGSPENSLAASSPVAPIEGASYPWLDQVLQQAAAEGITSFASTGDWGAYDQSNMGESLPYGGASYPSTDPYVTAIGGTSVYMNTTAGTLQFPYSNATGGYGSETAWSWSNEFSWGTGGGYSTLFPTPPWQHGTGFDSSIGTRGAPDLAWDADPATGVAIALYDPAVAAVSYFVEGGTSVGSPSWAGALATIEQKAGHKLGLITPQIYSIFNSPGEYSKVFHDVTSGNNNPDSAGVGWDPLTGIGSPNLGELANLIAPSGSLYVSARNSLTGQPASSFSYGSQVGLIANVTNSGVAVSAGSVTANILGPNGQTIASGIQLSFSSITNTWSGSYSIKSTDPPGEWSANIQASTGGLSGTGVTTFSVGDGINVYLPIFNVTTLAAAVPKFRVGQTINVTAKITSPDGSCCIISGNFKVSFNENSPSGKSEGTVPLLYNSSRELWIAHYKIPSTADQDSWAMTVAGTDTSGNSGTTYNWLYVGLNINLRTDSPTYVLGNTLTVSATPLYATGQEASTGSFAAVISDGAHVIATLPLALNPTAGFWMARLKLMPSSPTGFYLITVSGGDGRGSFGTAETVVRVSPYNLTGSITIPSPKVSINGGSEPMISARVTYPNGSLMTQGSVNAFVYLNLAGIHFLASLIRMTFNPSSGSFVGPDLLLPASPSNTSLGSYLVEVEAYDAQGNFANLTSSFFVTGESHPSISIADNSGFTAANGVVAGNGTALNPYVIAGWNTTSISISNGATQSYEIVNDWVSGSSGDGIQLNTSSATSALIEFSYAISNKGNGIVANNVPGATLIADVASGNALNGVLIANDSGLIPPDIGLTVASGNGLNGFTIQNAKFARVQYDVASSNGKFGFYLSNLVNSTVSFDNATRNPVGAFITGTKGNGYGVFDFIYSIMEQNGIGIEVNGLNQNVTGPNSVSSQVIAELDLITNNTVGVLAENQSRVELLGNTIGFNGVGVLYRNSVAFVVGNVIAQNNETALEISGTFSGRGGCRVTFVNSTESLFSSCISENYISLNGNSSSPASYGIQESNINGSFIEDNLDSNNRGTGLYLSNVTGSSVTLDSFNNNTVYGIWASSSSLNRIGKNNASSNLEGIVFSSGGTNQIDKNNLSMDSVSGIHLESSANNTIIRNSISSIGAGCVGLSSCKFAGGIELSNDSRLNSVTLNSITNITASGKVGAGLILNEGSTENLIYQNNATRNDAGIVISDSPSNTIAGNYLALNKYGVYLVGASNIDVASNTLFSDQQNVYPNQPVISFDGVRNGTSVSGVVTVSWNSTGQEIANQSSITIDGSPASLVTGSTYSWNSTGVPDGIHIITLKVSNGAGQNATATLIVSTTNHEFLIVEAVGPGNVPISGSIVTLKNSTYSTNQMTDTSGRALFHGLSFGGYSASASINGTAITSPVSYAANSTVILFVPDLVTTAQALSSSGTLIPIQVSGNLTASQLSNVALKSGNAGEYTVSFNLTGPAGSNARATISIPKNSTSNGLVPTVFINGNKTIAQSFSQDASNYYVTFIASFASGTQRVTIQLNQGAASIDVRYIIVVVVVIAIIAAGLVIATRGRNRRSYYLSSQPNV